MFVFRPMHVERDKETIVLFRRDSFLVSFGHIDGFSSEDKYVDWVTERSALFPDGFILVEEHGEAVGQIELQIVEYEDKRIGYVHLLYLVESYRDEGRGKELFDYAERFFQLQHVEQYHLRVSVTNERAIAFYKKMDLKIMKTELEGKVYRMNKRLEFL
ncbi:GNAT family N-acetyltransferase [Priestia taiwanensis]|uniref:N-acetyltransferase domain-containing protein n=1 Tax=Priestia taiwanensis TaxID=1347902 RepID=A0A917ANG5_9BACI|nr:GNAT family N-acetyltransferase [Priestia taiwanensis]MBM7362522.1 ribosomal protein S18 acetylase RimI-like enzyme [Priestia taiwanensis]GGE62893.1 hypothetical protein GCM10007140_11470 [Priestia taiwanensis]